MITLNIENSRHEAVKSIAFLHGLLYGQKLPCLSALTNCPQDPTHHQEGDAYTHTKLVCEALLNLPEFHKIPENERVILLAACLFHDTGKPSTTKHNDNGSISHPHHAFHGSRITRKALYQLNVEFPARELVCHLVRWHMKPTFAIEAPDPVKYITELSLSSRADLLAILSKSDNTGKIPRSDENLLLIDLFLEQAKELDCLDKPFKFHSDHAKYVFFNRDNWDAYNDAHDDTRCTVTIMSGLPGAGKDHWIEQNLPNTPQVSLDALRHDLKVKPTDEQAPVIQAARAKSKYFLGKSRDFIWNATNLSLLQRLRTMKLFKQFNAKLHVVYVETDHENLLKQNKARLDPVPEKVMDKLMDNWDMPLPTEAHIVEYVINNQTMTFPEILGIL